MTGGLPELLKTLLEPFGFVLRALPLSVLILALSVVFGSMLGMLLTFARLKKNPVSSKIAAVFISFQRGTPILVQLFLIYFGIPRITQMFGLDLSSADPTIFAVLAFTLNESAFLSETFRSSYLAVEKGQQEAAYSVGMNGWRSFHRIILPQAVRIGLPNFGNLVIELFKNTSLSFTIGVMDLMGRANQFITLDMGVKQVQTYFALAVIYWIGCIGIERIIALLEKAFVRGNASVLTAKG
jgi:L-cystine transport system permease protein